MVVVHPVRRCRDKFGDGVGKLTFADAVDNRGPIEVVAQSVGGQENGIART